MFVVFLIIWRIFFFYFVGHWSWWISIVPRRLTILPRVRYSYLLASIVLGIPVKNHQFSPCARLAIIYFKIFNQSKTLQNLMSIRGRREGMEICFSSQWIVINVKYNFWILISRTYVMFWSLKFIYFAVLKWIDSSYVNTWLTFKDPFWQEFLRQKLLIWKIICIGSAC